MREAKSTRSRLLEDVERGETVLIARNGRLIAELTAIVKPTLAAGTSVRALIAEGRR